MECTIPEVVARALKQYKSKNHWRVRRFTTKILNQTHKVNEIHILGNIDTKVRASPALNFFLLKLKNWVKPPYNPLHSLSQIYTKLKG